LGIIAYQKEVQPGVRKTFYMVVVEGINRYTGQRAQKKKRSISNRVTAERIYRELWSACRDNKPINEPYQYWGFLLRAYREHLDTKIRSGSNPLGFSPHTVHCKKSRLTHTEEWSSTHIDGITPMFVMNALDKMEANGMSRQNTNEVLKEVKCAFSFAIATGGLKTNLFAGTKMRKTPKRKLPALNHEEVETLLREAKLRSHPYYYVWLLTIALGLRRSELAGLKWIDVDFNQELIHVQRQLLPREGLVLNLKDWEDRLVAVPKHIIPLLKEMKLKTRTDFVIELDCPLWRSGGQAKILREFCREIGIKELSHHRLRATHITLALADDVPLAIVKENVGHAQLSTTDKYFSSSGIKMRGQMDRLRIPVHGDTGAEVIPMKNRK
jgi:integrase